MTDIGLADALGPRARRRVALVSVASAVVLLALVVGALLRLSSKGQLDAERWRPFRDWRVWRFLLWTGLRHTLEAAVVGMGLAMAVGSLLALGRLSPRRAVRWAAGAYVEFFRAVPLLLLILFSGLALPKYGVHLSLFGYLVLALVVYNSAVFGEIFRAGILSLDRGQSDAALALGLRRWQAMRLVIIPQAVRRMVPTIVSQLVTLLKDTSLGFVIAYEELLRTANSTGEYYKNTLQTTAVVAGIYIVVNFSLSRLARWLEVRQRRRYRAGALGVTGVEELAVVDAAAGARLEN